MSLFARPASADAVLAVAQHEVFGGRLAGRTPAMVQAAVRDRLSGLASWHPDGTISAHPLVRDTFRTLAMDAAEIAAETSLAGLPADAVASRADGLRVVEAIELLLEAGHWEAADDIYRTRSNNGEIWRTMPSARLGQRAAGAFVASPLLRDACDAHLGSRRMGFYVNDVGVFAAMAGDLTSAREYFSITVNVYRDADDAVNLAVGLQGLADCLAELGHPGPARDAAAEGLVCAQATDDREEIWVGHEYLAWVADLAGDTAEAERQSMTADKILHAEDVNQDHLYAGYGARWAERLLRTGRPGPARKLTIRNVQICQERGWNGELALCHRLLGRLALAAGDTQTAGEHLTTAATCLREGDYLIELAVTLTDLADCTRAQGDWAAAERNADEAIGIASPRGMVPAHSAALAARARIRASQTAADPDPLYQGRDAADAALRLAVRHHLPRHELDALRAHALLDEAEHTDRGWAAKADALHARLVPPDLDPDPLATVERLVAAEKAAEKAAGRSADDGPH